MPTSEEVGIRVRMENGDAVKGLNDIDQGMKKIKKTGEGFFQSMKGGWALFVTGLNQAMSLLGKFGAFAAKALAMAMQASQYNQIKTSFKNLADSVGKDSDKIVASLKAISRGTMDSTDIMLSASRALLIGIPFDQMEQMMTVARASAVAMGRSTKEMFDDLIVGIGYQSERMLRGTGIMVDSSEAYKKYASSLGISASALTEAQKKQAFFNAAMESALAIIKKVGSAVDKLTLPEKWGIMTSTIGDLRREIGERLSPAFEFAAVTLTKMVEKVTEGIRAKNELRKATKDLAEVTKQSYLIMSQAEIEAAIKTLDMDRTKLAVRIQLLQATKNISLEDMKMLLKLISTHDMLNQKINTLARDLVAGDVVWKDTNDTKKDVGLMLDDLIKKYKDLLELSENQGEANVNAATTDVEIAAALMKRKEVLEDLLSAFEKEGAAYKDAVDYQKFYYEMMGKINGITKEMADTRKKSLLESYAKELKLLEQRIEKGGEDIDTTNEQYLAYAHLAAAYFKAGLSADELAGVLSKMQDVMKKDNEAVKETGLYKKYLLEMYKRELQDLDNYIAKKGEENITNEESIRLYDEIITKYIAWGLSANDVADAIQKVRDNTIDLNEVVKTKLNRTLDDMYRQMYELPFDMLRDEMKLTAEAGTSFMGRLAIAFVNLGIDVLMTIAKIKLLQGLMLMFPKLGAGGGGLLKGLAAAYGGEVGKMPLKNLPRYARGGPMGGRAGGDVNLGLFKKGEYLIPPERVTPWTRPVLAAIRTGRYKRYAEGGEVGGEGVMNTGGDIQLVNVVTEDLLMGVVDKNKRVFVNYITADLLANGMTRRTIKRTS